MKIEHKQRKKIKVLIITPYYSEPHRWMISAYKTALCFSQKFSVVVLTAGEPSFEQKSDNLKIYRMKDIFIPDPVNFSIVPGFLWHLLKVIIKEKPDLFIVNKNMFYTSFAILWLRFLRKKVFVQVDAFPGIVWFSRSKFVNAVLWVYARTIGLFLLKLSHKVILFHEGLVPVAKKFGLNYMVIHNGIDFSEISASQPAKDLRNRIKGEIRVIYVGRLESVKGYMDYLITARKMIKNYPNLKFFLAGNIDRKKEIVKKYRHKQIVFLGHRKDVLSVLKTMDIYVLTSYSEGLPNSLMEAMASGLACVASNVGGVKTLLQDNINGLVFNPGDQRNLEEKITLLFNNDFRKKLSLNAVKTIDESYNMEKIISQYIKLFKKSGGLNQSKRELF